MTVSSAETAEYRGMALASPPLVLVPPIGTGATPLPPVADAELHPALLGRAALRAERQHARRQRRLWACAGLSILAATLAAAVAVLSMAR
jgi:hypothetical protein